ncbi:MAG TPA: PDGLE domain-containing protein [Pseudonocardiaceae bacterium]|nr:PDGLE domain-containing protein [Pseudonocardiaceae bacterium]
MTASHSRRGPVGFFVSFGVIAILIAGLLSYLASSNPDGLDTVTLNGCEVTEVDGGEQLSGECIAQNARNHALADSPLADYTLGGNDKLVGVAGVIGVLVTLALAGGLFWLARPRRRAADQTPTDTT